MYGWSLGELRVLITWECYCLGKATYLHICDTSDWCQRCHDKPESQDGFSVWTVVVRPLMFYSRPARHPHRLDLIWSDGSMSSPHSLVTVSRGEVFSHTGSIPTHPLLTRGPTADMTWKLKDATTNASRCDCSVSHKRWLHTDMLSFSHSDGYRVWVRSPCPVTWPDPSLGYMYMKLHRTPSVLPLFFIVPTLSAPPPPPRVACHPTRNFIFTALN